MQWRWVMLGLGVLLGASAQAEPRGLAHSGWLDPLSSLQKGWTPAAWKALDRLLDRLDTQSLVVVEDGYLIHQYGHVAQPYALGDMKAAVLHALWSQDVLPRGPITREQTDQMHLVDAAWLQEASWSSVWGGWSQAPERTQGFLLRALETFGQTPPHAALYHDLILPLGMQDTGFEALYSYQPSPTLENTRFDVALSARDLARVGAYYMKEVRWGTRLKRSEARQQEGLQPVTYHTPLCGKGPLANQGMAWWTPDEGRLLPGIQVPDDAFASCDASGQMLLVFPSWRWVIVHQLDRTQGSVSWQALAEVVLMIMQAKNYAFEDLRSSTL